MCETIGIKKKIKITQHHDLYYGVNYKYNSPFLEAN